MFMICIVLLLCLACSTKASEFSIGYLASPKISIKVFNVGGVLETTPDALHVADLYTRLNGMTPLLSTDYSKLPVLDILSSPQQKNALLVEMTAAPGQIMPVAATLVAGTRGTTERQESYPSLADVVAALEQHGVSVRSEHVDAREMSEEAVQQWLHKQQQSGVAVVILHRSDTSSARNLGSSSSSTATPPTLFEISQYQITLWTAIGLVAITLSAVIALGGMHVEPDSILYAKFISGRTKND